MNEQFWRGKRVLVTGHTGFKGGWLCLWLQQLGAEVTGYALAAPTKPSLFDTARVGEGMRSIIGDIRDLDHLVRVFDENQPEIVIHMAAQPLVRLSYKEPVETYSTNVMGTVLLLEAVRRTSSVRAVVNVTSDKCYENREWVWGYRETEPMGGFDPYSNSKGCAELVTDAYRNSYFNPHAFAEHRVALASGRAGNVIGGGDWAGDRLIPDMMRAVSACVPVQIRNPHAIRPWQHVLEPLSGYLLLAEKLHTEGTKFTGGWNFGPNDSDTQPVQWIVEHLVSRWGDGAAWQRDAAPQPHEATYLKLDCSKAKNLLGWSPRWTLSEAIDHIVEWHQAFLRNADMRALSLSQINAYQVK
ncbi:CDP-glucose 4,6-dehydratase [Paraburkholderia sp. BL23I1N1]|uniref:CDP-glucose 4,6-dehydratase n=1 Tax=Paraburkholderia sp. BL23I1N1 TaxID=1938802 RepID=UPI000FF464BE|nr:CDP-glucose 4,6-dehydratase [Paraburkholderia sp. BL23I1N1]RKE26294.1 CDP-glucose 4,6-dehydratase [Paraburkholderia sp. BL23I1N1]